MNHAIRIHGHGGPEVMQWEEVPLPQPKAGEALVRHGAVGLNYIDVYFRTGLYKVPTLPAVLGMEGAGVVEAIGEGVTEVAVGDRVAYAMGPIGAYAEARVVKADVLVKLPDGVADEQAAAMMAWEIPTALWSDLRDAGLIRSDAPVPVAIAPRSLD